MKKIRTSASDQLKRGEIMHLRAKLSVVVLLIVLSLVTVVPALAQGPNEFDTTWTYSEFVYCANDWAGEDVDLTGTIHITWGNEVWHANLQNASGVGATTGDVYRAIGAVAEFWISADQTDVFAIIDNFRLIGPGPDNNLFISLRIHVTFANGEVTAIIDDESVRCR